MTGMKIKRRNDELQPFARELRHEHEPQQTEQPNEIREHVLRYFPEEMRDKFRDRPYKQ